MKILLSLCWFVVERQMVLGDINMHVTKRHGNSDVIMRVHCG